MAYSIRYELIVSICYLYPYVLVLLGKINATVLGGDEEVFYIDGGLIVSHQRITIF